MPLIRRYLFTLSWLFLSSCLCIAGEEPGYEADQGNSTVNNGNIKRQKNSVLTPENVEEDLNGNSRHLDTVYSSKIGEFNLLDDGKLEGELNREEIRVKLLEKIKQRIRLQNELNGPSASVSSAGNYGVHGLHLLKVWGKQSNEYALVSVNGRYLQVQQGDMITPNIRLVSLDYTSGIFEVNGKQLKLGLSGAAAFKDDLQNNQNSAQPGSNGFAIPLGPGRYSGPGIQQ